jgi:hypothetical protein
VLELDAVPPTLFVVTFGDTVGVTFNEGLDIVVEYFALGAAGDDGLAFGFEGV